VPFVVGPTAVGKTSMAVELAQHLPVTVISADSRQVYRRLDIGTAKPTPEELRTVPHLGIDVVDPGETYSAGRFAADANEWLRSIPSGRLAMVVGGTGFYVRALADGLFQEPPMDQHARTRLREWAKSYEGLSRWAARLDPNFTGGGRQRAARAVEVALLTGRPLSWWQHQANIESPITPFYVRLTAPRSVLHQRIETRVDSMLEAGLVAEVDGILDSGISPNAPGLDAVGYREVVACLKGVMQLDELASRITISTRRYAKRQETWFRHQLRSSEVLNLDVTDGSRTNAERFLKRWEKRI